MIFLRRQRKIAGKSPRSTTRPRGAGSTRLVRASGSAWWPSKAPETYALAVRARDLAALNGSGVSGQPGTSGGALSDLEQLRLLLLAFQSQQGNPLVTTALGDCIAMAQQTKALGGALPLEFQNLMNQLLVTAMNNIGSPAPTPFGLRRKP